MPPDIEQLESGNEMKRKAIHLATAFFPLLYFFYLNQEQITIILVIITMVFLLAEYVRFNRAWGRRLFERIFFPLLRENEKKSKLSGATLYFLSASVTVILFPKMIAVPAILVLSVSDSLAAVAGKIAGRHKFLSKSLEGSVTFFLCSILLLSIFTPGMHSIEKIVVAGVVSLVEASALPVNDNLTIPLSAAILLKLVI